MRRNIMDSSISAKKRVSFFHNILFLISLLFYLAMAKRGNAQTLPNVILILADDFGVGDIKAYYPDNKVNTPNLDRLVNEGLSFTDAHSGSAVSTPSRYGLLTGRYAWRSRLQYHVLHRYDAPLLKEEQLTLPEILKEQGYNTACIGKWHLGHNWIQNEDRKSYDYSAKLTGGAIDHGFDYYFGTDVPNFEPYTFIENQNIYILPTDTFPSGKERWIQQGPCAPGWKFDQILPTLTDKACAYLGEQAKKKEPFFLYFSMTSPHEPIAPSPRFKGQTEHIMFDFLRETDWSIGQVLNTIDELGIFDNTIVIFTADNGHNNYTYWKEITELGHQPSGIYRGHKGDIWEGGHRVPFIIRWPGITKSQGISDQLICLNDVIRTIAEITGYIIPEDQAPDSYSFLPALKGKTQLKGLRHTVINHDVDGRFAIRNGKYKLVCFPPAKSEDAKQSFHFELYDLKEDPSETKNIAPKFPNKVEVMKSLLEKQINNGRSTVGISLNNDRKVFYDALPEEYLIKN